MQFQALSDVSQREQDFLQDLAPQSLQRTPRLIKNGAKQQAQRPSSTTTRFVSFDFESFRFSRFLPQRILRKKCFIGRSASIRSHNEHQREYFALLSSSKSKDDELFCLSFDVVSPASFLIRSKMSRFSISKLSIFLFYLILLTLFPAICYLFLFFIR